MKNIGKFESLHCHTTTSDGQLSHQEILAVAENNNIGVVAFTDHDAVIPVNEVEKLRKKSRVVDWISGIEMSVGMPFELEQFGGDFHIVGLFIDPTNLKLLEHCQKAKQSRIERMQKMVINLQGLGFNISEEDCLRASSGESVGRPHIVSALKSKTENVAVIEKLRQRMAQEAEDNPDVKTKYDEMMKQGEKEYPYALFLDDEAFISGVYVHYLYKLPFDDSVALIRSSGGLAFFAHWFTDKHKFTIELVDKFFEENRLDGMEVVYGLDVVDQDLNKKTDFLQQFQVLGEKVTKYKKLKSGGVDAHQARHFELLEEHPWYAERTVGLAEQIIKNSGVNTHWSSFVSNI